MKTLLLYITFIALFLTSCSTSYYASEPVPYDDVYYTANKIPIETQEIRIGVFICR